MLGGPRSLWYALTLLTFDMTSLTPSKEQKGGEVAPEKATADPARTNVTHSLPLAPQGPLLGTENDAGAGGVDDPPHPPPSSGDATGLGSQVDVKQPPVAARHPSKKASRKPNVQDPDQEAGGGGDGGVLAHGVQTPLKIGSNGYPDCKVMQAVGGGTKLSSPAADSSTAGGVTEPKPSSRQRDASGLENPVVCLDPAFI